MKQSLRLPFGLAALWSTTLLLGASTAIAAGKLQPELAALRDPAVAARSALASRPGANGGAGAAGLSALSPLWRGDRLLVQIAPTEPARGVTTSDSWSAAVGRLEAALRGVDGVAVEGTLESTVYAAVSPDALDRIAALEAVRYVSIPIPPRTLVRSDAIYGMRVPEFQSLGYNGRGVRIGVIDVGFDAYGSLLGAELPAKVTARSFFAGENGNGDITGRGERHGTACAEIVYDVVPGAELYLANVATDLDLARAVSWMIDSGVEVISHSLAWFIGGGDGTGPINSIVRRATEEGVLFVSAGGNFARSHWGGTFRDEDQDGDVEFDLAGDETITLPSIAGGNTVSLALTWDRWPFAGDERFEIEIRNASGTVLATSYSSFANSIYAYRLLDYTAPSGATGLTASVVVREGDGAGIHLRLFLLEGGVGDFPEHRVAAGSVAIPADSPEVLSVGAFRYNLPDPTQEELEDFSSFGPTVAGVSKPEILGPDGVATESWPGSFTGTSAACPHVAGAAALLLSASVQGGLFDARWSLDDLRRLLASAALPLTTEYPDGSAGWGRVRLILDRPSRNPSPLRPLPGLHGAPHLRLALAPGERAPVLRLYDAAGRQLETVEASSTAPGSAEYLADPALWSARARGVYFARTMAATPAAGSEGAAPSASTSLVWLGAR